MSAFPNSPRLIKDGIVLVDPDSGAVQKFIAPRHNPDTPTRTLRPQGVQEGGDRSGGKLLRQLAQLVGEQDAPSSLLRQARWTKLEVPLSTHHTRHNARAIGRQIAQTVYQGLSQ